MYEFLIVGLSLLTIAIPYLLGCLNGAVIISKYVLKDDIRNHGSGNAGLTNFHRTFGGKLTAAVLALDVVKMVVAVLLVVVLVVLMLSLDLEATQDGADIVFNWCWKAAGEGYGRAAKYWAGLWCLLGHMFPITFGLKGGKGVLSGVTLMFCLDWRMGLIALGIFLVVVVLTRYISLGSCLAALSFPVGTWLFVGREQFIVAMSVILTALVIFMHRGNLARILKGEERKFSLHRKKD